MPNRGLCNGSNERARRCRSCGNVAYPASSYNFGINYNKIATGAKVIALLLEQLEHYQIGSRKNRANNCVIFLLKLKRPVRFLSPFI